MKDKKRSNKVQILITILIAGLALLAYQISTGGMSTAQNPKEDVSLDATWLTDEMIKSSTQREAETIILAEKTTNLMDAITAVMNQESEATNFDFSQFFSEGAIERNFPEGSVDRASLQTFFDWDSAIDFYELEEASFSPNPNTGVENTLAGVRVHFHYFDEQSMSILLWEKQDEVWKIEGVMNMGH